jgi:DNA repair exonuclease SbcCD ATPase subunit
VEQRLSGPNSNQQEEAQQQEQAARLSQAQVEAQEKEQERQAAKVTMFVVSKCFELVVLASSGVPGGGSWLGGKPQGRMWPWLTRPLRLVEKSYPARRLLITQLCSSSPVPSTIPSLQTKRLEGKLAAAEFDRDRMSQRCSRLEAELESVRRTAAREQSRLAGACSALATELEEERKASAQVLACQLDGVQKDAEDARNLAEKLEAAQKDAAAARALAAELKEVRREAERAKQLQAELEAARRDASQVGTAADTACLVVVLWGQPYRIEHVLRRVC